MCQRTHTHQQHHTQHTFTHTCVIHIHVSRSFCIQHTKHSKTQHTHCLCLFVCCVCVVLSLCLCAACAVCVCVSLFLCVPCAQHERGADQQHRRQPGSEYQRTAYTHTYTYRSE